MSDFRRTVYLDKDIYSSLHLANWTQLTELQKEQVVDHLLQQLSKSSYQFELKAWTKHGPQKQQEVLKLWDPKNQISFSLIPGGDFTPGFTQEDLRAYAQIHQALYAWKSDDPWIDNRWNFGEDMAEEDREDAFFDPPTKTQIFASMAYCDLTAKPQVQIPPFLMSSDLVPDNLPELDKVYTFPDWWDSMYEVRGSKTTSSAKNPLKTDWPAVSAVLKKYNWGLPTAFEFEWASSAGNRHVFYWGNEIPVFILTEMVVSYLSEEELIASFPPCPAQFEDIMSLQILSQKERKWPYANHFGLTNLLSSGTWCHPDPDSNQAFPLVIKGGAAGSYPWQDCGEWKSFLRPAIQRLAYDTEYSKWNAFRPVIHFAPY